MKNIPKFSLRCTVNDIHGIGVSSSSTFAIIYAASQIYLKTKAQPPSRADIARLALMFERASSSQHAIAAQDVYPITYGGAVKTITEPDTVCDGRIVQGKISVESIPCDAKWVENHFLLAANFNAEKHDAPGLLSSLYNDHLAADYVASITDLADTACDAIIKKDIVLLAMTIEKYKTEFDKWTGGKYLAKVKQDIDMLSAKHSSDILAWKPPGAGGSKSVIVIAPTQVSRNRLIKCFNELGWWASPVKITGGVSVHDSEEAQSFQVSAGHRVDIVGAADLGQDISIGQKGHCCGFAIKPRVKIIVKRDIQVY